MADIEELKRNALLMFANILRTSSLSGQVNAQRVQMVMGQWLEGLVEGVPLDVNPFYEFLKSEGLPLEGIHELLWFLKTREDRLGFPIALPLVIETLPEAKKAKYVEQFKKTAISTTYSGTKSDAAPSPAARASYDDIIKKKSRVPRVAVFAGLGVVVAVGLFFLPQLEEAPVPLTEIPTVLTPAALACSKLEKTGTVAVCRIAKVAWSAMGKDEQQRRLATTLKELEGTGVQSVIVMSSDDGKLLAQK